MKRPVPQVRALLTASGMACLTWLAGCASPPAPADLRQPQAAAAQASATLAARPAAWPGDLWWTAYGDAQLDRLIAEALEQAPDMAIAAARLRQAEAVRGVVASAELPQVRGSASATSARQSENYLFPKGTVPEGWHSYGNAALEFDWEIDFWGRTRAAVAAATSELEAARAENAQARLALASAIARHYAELARLFAARDHAVSALDIRAQAEQLFAERLRHGLETEHRFSEAQAARLQTEGELLQIDEQIALLRHRLAALAGAGPDRGLALERPRLVLERDFGLPERLTIDLLGRRPDIVAARHLVEAQLRRVEQKQAEFYPNVSLAGFIGLQSFHLSRLTDSGSLVGSVGPAVSLPIFNGGRLRSELRQGQARYDEALARYERTLTQSLQELADATSNLQSLQARLDKARQRVTATTTAYRLSRQRYEGQLASRLETLQAQEAMLAAQKALSDLQAQAVALDVALVHALGGGYRSNEI